MKLWRRKDTPRKRRRRAGKAPKKRVRGPGLRRYLRPLALGVSGAAGGVLLAAALLAARPLVQNVATHPYFAIEEISISPTTRVPPARLLALAGLRLGQSIWAVDPGAVAARLERHPWIREASVRRLFPRRLAIRVTERQPVAILLLEDLYYIDGAGVVFARVGTGDSIDLPLVSGIGAAVAAGEVPYTRHALRQALKVLHAFHRAGLPFRVSEVHIEREQGITVFPVEPRVALRVGWRAFPVKLARLAEVLHAFAGREAEIQAIDVTYGTQAVIRLRQPIRGAPERV